MVYDMKRILMICAAMVALATITACKNGVTSEPPEDTVLWFYCEELNQSNIWKVQKAGKVAFQRHKSDSIINNQWYDEASEYSHGFWAVKLNGKWGTVDTTGNIKIPLIFDSVLTLEDGFVFSEYGIGYFKYKGEWLCIDTAGKEVPEIYLPSRI
jgi:hypothetical protein